MMPNKAFLSIFPTLSKYVQTKIITLITCWDISSNSKKYKKWLT